MNDPTIAHRSIRISNMCVCVSLVVQQIQLRHFLIYYHYTHSLSHDILFIFYFHFSLCVFSRCYFHHRLSKVTHSIILYLIYSFGRGFCCCSLVARDQIQIERNEQKKKFTCGYKNNSTDSITTNYTEREKMYMYSPIEKISFAQVRLTFCCSCFHYYYECQKVCNTNNLIRRAHIQYVNERWIAFVVCRSNCDFDLF